MIKLFKRRPKQSTYCYCPRCNNELVSSNSFVADRDGIVEYQCSRCNEITFWDFARYPVPYLRTCGDCHYLIDDCCLMEENHECSPDTQKLFVAKGQYCEYCMGDYPVMQGMLSAENLDELEVTINTETNDLYAHNHDVHGNNTINLYARIKYCPMCGRKLEK